MLRFIEFSGKHTDLCKGVLTVEFNGERIELSDFLKSSGGFYINDLGTDVITIGDWKVIKEKLPEDLQPYALAIQFWMNKFTEKGCCGGCLENWKDCQKKSPF